MFRDNTSGRKITFFSLCIMTNKVIFALSTDFSPLCNPIRTMRFPTTSRFWHSVLTFGVRRHTPVPDGPGSHEKERTCGGGNWDASHRGKKATRHGKNCNVSQQNSRRVTTGNATCHNRICNVSQREMQRVAVRDAACRVAGFDVGTAAQGSCGIMEARFAAEVFPGSNGGSPPPGTAMELCQNKRANSIFMIYNELHELHEPFNCRLSVDDKFVQFV